jgi:branched-chain amino acid transport system permease protein
VAFVVPALAGLVLERTLYARLYNANPLDQVLFTIGIVFASMATASYFMGSQHQIIQLPPFLQGQYHVMAGFDVGIYRLFLLGFCGLIALFLHLVLMRTRFGSRLRAAVDNGRIAQGLGINVNRLFAITFAMGSGLAGLGGALGIEILNLDPVFPVKFLVYFLIVVAVGGTGTVGGPLAAALILGIFDVAGKYYVSQIGAFVIYAVMVIMLIWRPQGLFGRRAVD